MVRLLLITLLILLCRGPAYAEWTELGYAEAKGDSTVYADRDTILRKGNLAKMWVLWDYKTVQRIEENSFFSRRVQHQFDCAEGLWRVLAFTWFSGNMEKGNVLINNSVEGTWAPVSPRSIVQTMWKVACAKK